MRKLPKAAVAAAVIALVGFIGTGSASAAPSAPAGHGGGCRSHDLNLDVLGQVGLLNGLLGNAINGEGNPGGQANHVGSECD
ncbi:hypothetical protein [Streptomyces sp. NPDC057616]|uniref:hypothetical protein n=1 Tax=Streptomyces sp. NPDC057616 TaxID=3346183 RepID=UPI00368A0E94